MCLLKEEEKHQAFDFFPPSISILVDGFVNYVILLTSDNHSWRFCAICISTIKIVFNHNWSDHGPCFLFFVLYENFIQIKFNLNLFKQVPLLFSHKFLIGWFIFTKLFFIWHYLWVLKFIKVGVPSVSSWIFNDFLKVVDLKKQQKNSRLEVDKTLNYCII